MTNLSFDSIWELMKEYDFELTNDFHSDMICSICKKVMKNACSGICGCKYCFDCIRNYLNGGNMYCPGGLQFCNEEIMNIEENIRDSHALNFRIIRTIVKCPLGSCGHEDELRNMEDHVRTCESRPVNCPYFNVGCDKDKLGVDKMKDHLEIENYGHTKLLIEYVDNLKNEMELLKGQMAELKHTNYQHKLDGERKQVEIGELQTNLKVNCEQVELLNAEMSALKKENRLTKEQINNFINKDRPKQVSIGELQAKLEGQSRQIDQWKEKSDQSDESIKKIEDKTENLNLKIGQMQTNLDKQNEFVWVIEGISGKMKQAKEGITTDIYSDAFFSHKNGYKMCLEVDPDGNGDGEGSHLSVFFCLMLGPFDDILSWPFKGDVTLSLMNQKSGLVHKTKIINYEDDPNNSSYLKPTEKRNVGLGFDLIKQDELLSNAALTKDDKIIFKCSVQFPKNIIFD